MNWRIISTILIIVGIILAIGWVGHYFVMTVWFRAILSNLWINPFRLIRMRLQNMDPKQIILPMITSTQAGLNVPIARLESHHLAKGDVEKVLKALIIARKGGFTIDFGKAAAIDLAGFDVVQSVQSYMKPKVIKTSKVTAEAKDGVQLTVAARITVQTDFDRLIGGGGEETILAIVEEQIVRAIGSAETHKDIQAAPDNVSNQIAKRLQEPERSKILGYKVLSVDIESIETGKNMGAERSIRRAEAETKIAQSNAEKAEQEMKVRVLEKRAALMDAEAQVPLAIAAAIREGKVNLMDYYRMKNIVADTKMRDSLASSDEPTLEELMKDDNDEDHSDKGQKKS